MNPVKEKLIKDLHDEHNDDLKQIDVYENLLIDLRERVQQRQHVIHKLSEHT